MGEGKLLSRSLLPPQKITIKITIKIIIILIFFLKSLINLVGDVRELTAEVGTGALSVGEPFVHSQVTRGVACKVEALDAVSLTDVNAEVDESSHSDIANVPLSANFVVSHLNSDSAVVVGTVR